MENTPIKQKVRSGIITHMVPVKVTLELAPEIRALPPDMKKQALRISAEIVLQDAQGNKWGGYLLPTREGPTIPPEFIWGEKIRDLSMQVMQAITKHIDQNFFPEDQGHEP